MVETVVAYKTETIADGVLACVHPTGSWGYNNAGIIIENGEAVLVDTLFDMTLTQMMMKQFHTVFTDMFHVKTVINTHANGDHWYGNDLFPDCEIITSRASEKEMHVVPPKIMSVLMSLAKASVKMGPLSSMLGGVTRHLGKGIIGSVLMSGPYLLDAFGAFDFKNVSVRWPNRLFDNELIVSLGERPIVLKEMGPAHTLGDLVVFDSKARVLFTGDLFFNGAHPLVWTGEFSKWIDACDQMAAMAPDVVVPGHGPITDVEGLRRFQTYLKEMDQEIRRCFNAGLNVVDSAKSILKNLEQPLLEPERMVLNVDALYRKLNGRPPRRSIVPYFHDMSKFKSEIGG